MSHTKDDKVTFQHTVYWNCVPFHWHRDLCLLPHDPQTVMKAAKMFKSSTQDPLAISMNNFYMVAISKTMKLNNKCNYRLTLKDS